MALVQPVNNKVTLWQGFSTFSGQIDMLVIYEPTHLKVVVMHLYSSTKDLISVEFMRQQMRLVTRESGFRQTCSGNRTSCWSEETKRSLWIPFPTNPKMAQWEENNNILSVSIPWLTV
uniref:Maturase K n=1 Tax=Lygus hesperus TaxID=30085 RepID=A0A0A9Y4D6_LYGHE